MSFKEKFTYVYDNKIWGDGSGGGSNIDLLWPFVNWMNEFIKEKGIKSVLDYGCGMSGLGQHIQVEKYLGVDIVESVINHCNDNFKSDSISYELNQDEEYYRPADLLLIKDVFCHWPYKSIEFMLMMSINHYKYIVLVNSCKQTEDYQPYTIEPHLQGLGLSYLYEPLKKWEPQLIMKLEKNPNDPKEVLLITKI